MKVHGVHIFVYLPTLDFILVILLIFISRYLHGGLRGRICWASSLPGLTSLTSSPAYLPLALTAADTPASLYCSLNTQIPFHVRAFA